MDSPIDPVVPSPATLADATVLDFPLLTSNPGLLQAVESAANNLGTTYQAIASAIATGLRNTQTCTVAAYNSVVDQLNNYTSALQNDYHTVVSGISNDILGRCNTILSGIMQDVEGCQLSIEDAINNLKPGQYLHFSNPTLVPPDDSLWLTKWDQWLLHSSPDVYIDSQGNIVSGVWLRDDYSFSPDTVNAAIKPWTLNGYLFATGYTFPNVGVAPPTEGVVDYTPALCNNVMTGTQGINPPTIQPPPIPVPPPSPPVPVVPIQGNPVPPLPPPVPPPIQQPIQQDGSTVCPQPIVNIQVNPTPITINVPACPPPTVINDVNVAPVAGGTGTTTEGVSTWEPDVKDVTEQFLNTLGFPKDFVEWYGAQVNSEDAQDIGSKTTDIEPPYQEDE